MDKAKFTANPQLDSEGFVAKSENEHIDDAMNVVLEGYGIPAMALRRKAEDALRFLLASPL